VQSLRAKILREVMLKKSEEKTWERASLRKETLKNRKEDFKSKVLRKNFRSKILKNCKGTRPLRIKIEKSSRVK
jgi:hypothetical protein